MRLHYLVGDMSGCSQSLSCYSRIGFSPAIRFIHACIFILYANLGLSPVLVVPDAQSRAEGLENIWRWLVYPQRRWIALSSMNKPISLRIEHRIDLLFNIPPYK
jgi:hypothetical protein